MSNYNDTCRISCRYFEIKYFREHIEECEFPDEMEKLLNEYETQTFSENPDAEHIEELLNVIESQYSTKTLREAYFGSGSLWGEMQRFVPRLKTALKFKKYNQMFDKPILIFFILLIVFGFIYNTFVRYKYTVYKGKLPYTAEIIKVDRLTGDVNMTVIRPDNLKK